MKPVTKYAYLKPQENEDSPYYVLVVLDEPSQLIKVYYHMSWWKKEEVKKDIFEHWMQNLRDLVPCLNKHAERSLKKSPIKSKNNSVRVRGKCHIYASVFKDIIGFTEKDVAPEIPVKIQGYVNSADKVIEICLELPYKHLGCLPAELHKLPIFTTNPDAEIIRKRLLFFNMKHIIGFQGKLKKSQYISSQQLPKHDGSPHSAALSSSRKKENHSAPLLDESSTNQTTENGPQWTDHNDHDDARKRELEDFKLDPIYCTGQHPFGHTLSTNIDESKHNPEQDHGPTKGDGPSETTPEQ